MNKKTNGRLTHSLILTLFVLLSGILLGACQNLRGPTPSSEASTHERSDTTMAPIDTFRLKGKVSLKESANAGPKRHARADKLYTAEIHWDQAGDRYGIDLSGPLNQGHIKIIGDNQLATLWDQQANAHRATSPEQLLADVTGVSFPLEALIDWVTGRPQRLQNLEDVTWETLPDGTRKIQQFSDRGWIVTYREWATWDDLWLPRKMQLEDGERTLKVFVYAWENLSEVQPAPPQPVSKSVR